MRILIYCFLLNILLFSNSVFISEYVEASSSTDNYLEIYNGTDSTIDLSEYKLTVTRQNGTQHTIDLNDTSFQSINNGLLEPSYVLIIIKSDYADLCHADYLDCTENNIQFIEWSYLSNMNGDDAVELYYNDSTLLDVIGIPGEDPGDGWDVAGIQEATKNHTLIRKPNITEGNTNWNESSGNADDSEWYVYPNETYSFGGYHDQNDGDIIFGCTNSDACNFNPDAVYDDGSCLLYDACGVCNGDNSPNTGICGICNGPGAVYECGCTDIELPYCDCNGSTIDNCGVCDDDSTNNCVQDCFGVWGGNALLDECGICNGPGAVYQCGCYCESENVDFIYNWNDGDGQYNPGLRMYNDIWGYISADSIEYALIGAWNGTYIIDISNENPIEVGFIEGAWSGWRDIKTYNNYMYIGTEGAQGIQVVDINNPNNPVLMNEWDLINSSHNIMEYNGYLYVIGAPNDVNNNGNVSDLIVLDINTDPGNPQYVDEWSGQYLHDVCMYDNILYGCGIYNHTMYAIDISDPTNVSLITSWDGIPSAHACWVSENGNTLFTASETSGGHIMSWDVTDLGNINLLDEWMPPNGEIWSAHNIFIKNNHLYISYYVYGLQILDISDPSDMYRVGYFDVLDEIELNFGINDIYNGVWGAFPYYNSDKIVISDRDRGLFVLEEYYNMIGDLNNDAILNVIDIVAIVNIIMDNSYNILADINQDSIVDVTDIIALVNIILN